MIIVSITDADLEVRADRSGLAAVGDVSGMSCASDVEALDSVVLLGLAAEFARATEIGGEKGVTVAEVEQAFGATPRHAWVVGRWLADLVEFGMVDRMPGHRFRMATRPTRSQLTQAREYMIDACARLGYARSLSTMLLDSLRHAPGLLSGSVPVQAILYPDGDPATALEVYGDNVISTYLNAAATSVVASIASESTAPLRILELGAGIGATSEHVLSALCPDRPGDASSEGASPPAALGEYVFTDLSPHLLAIARSRFADRSWARHVTYKVVDITGSLAEQVSGASGRFDVVMAATMAHNALDVNGLLEQTHDLLAPGGAVLLVETVVERPQSLTTMPFALSNPDGSGPPERTDVRAGSHRTYLSRSEWIAALRGADLMPCVDLPQDGHPLDSFSQRLFVATRKNAPIPSGDDC